MKKILYLIIAITGNALGTTIMLHSELGMTAWGSSSLNFGNFFNIQIGTSFMILSIFFYLVALVIRKKIEILPMILSMVFLFSFSFLTNYFDLIIPGFNNISIIGRIILNTFGLLILFFAIAVHLKVNIAIHPMDVYLQTMQIKFKSVAKGTYFAYSSAFLVVIIFGLAAGGIEGVSLGTINTLLFGGLILALFDKIIPTV